MHKVFFHQICIPQAGNKARSYACSQDYNKLHFNGLLVQVMLNAPHILFAT